MASLPTLTAQVSFDEAIAFTQDLMQLMGEGEITDIEVERAIAQLVQSMNGARGFFVTYLSSESSLADKPAEAVLRALQTAPETVASLLVKNVAMSTAMSITHRQQNHPELAEGSLQVQRRSVLLIEKLRSPEIKTELQQLAESLSTGSGDYQAFLERWGYDTEQKQEIERIIQGIKLS
jgi:hypothetical protein